MQSKVVKSAYYLTNFVENLAWLQLLRSNFLTNFGEFLANFGQNLTSIHFITNYGQLFHDQTPFTTLAPI